MTTDVTGLVRKVEDHARRVRDQAADLVVQACRDDAPVSQATPTNPSPGRLRDALALLTTDDASPHFGATVGTQGVDYASYTDEEDTDPHTIYGNPLLRFWWENGPGGPGIYTFRHVNHPGTRGQRWFASKMQDRWTDALRRVVS